MENATRICEAKFGNLWLREGDKFRIVAIHGGSPDYCEYLYAEPLIVPDAQGAMARVVSHREVVQIDDISKAPTHGSRMRIATIKIAKARTLVGVPMLKDKEVVGIIAIYRQEVRPFTDKQIELVQNFAAQAVIAIENTRLLNELRESLQQQTATADVLKVISSSPGELEPVFQAMLENATRLCEAPFGGLFLRDAELIRLVASHVPPSAPATIFQPGSQLAVSDNAIHPLVRMIDSKAVVHIADMRTDQSYVERNPRIAAFVDTVGARTVLCVPMLKDNEYVGAFIIFRLEVRPFTDKQIELVQNFAAQAVIAIDNARLLNELRQSLEQQTATSQVLQVISSSPGDLEPVFTTILENATRICQAKFGNVYLWDGDAFRLVAAHNTPPAFAESRRREPFRPKPSHPFSRMAATKQVLHVPDAAALPAYIERDPQIVEPVELGGVRTCLAVPMLKEDNLIGALIVYRQEVRPFTDKQIALIANFADQAVIAIENTRLLERAARIAAAADRDRRRAQGHQPLDLRSAIRARYADRIGGAALRSRYGQHPDAGRGCVSDTRPLRSCSRSGPVRVAAAAAAGP